jgi:hypothetical protein
MPLPFTPGETSLGTHCIEDWVGLRAGLEIMEKRKFSCPYWKLNPNNFSVIQFTA